LPTGQARISVSGNACESVRFSFTCCVNSVRRGVSNNRVTLKATGLFPKKVLTENGVFVYLSDRASRGIVNWVSDCRKNSSGRKARRLAPSAL